MDTGTINPVTGKAEKTPGVLLVLPKMLERGRFKKLLEAKNHQVQEAKNSGQAKGLLAAAPFDLAVVSMELAEGSGIDLLEDLDHEGLGVPSIIVTDELSVETTLQCMRVGVVDMLIRPLEDDDFIAACEKILERQAQYVRRRADAGVTVASKAPRRSRSLAGARPAVTPAAGPTQGQAPRQPPSGAPKIDIASLDLPACPGVVHELQRLLKDPNYNTGELARLVEGDQQLAVLALKQANRGKFQNFTEATSVSDALLRLGAGEVLSLAMRVMTRRMGHRLETPALADLAGEYWSRTVHQALAARIVATKVPKMDPDDLYLAALLSEIGEPFLLRYLDQTLRAKGVTVTTEQARRDIATHHVQMGGALLTRWGMKSETVHIALHHHDAKDMRRLASAQNPLAKVLFIVALAQHAVRHWKQGDLQAEAHRDAMRAALAEGRSAASVEVPEIALEAAHPSDPSIPECTSVLGLGKADFKNIVRQLRTELEAGTP